MLHVHKYSLQHNAMCFILTTVVKIKERLLFYVFNLLMLSYWASFWVSTFWIGSLVKTVRTASACGELHDARNLLYGDVTDVAQLRLVYTWDSRAPQQRLHGRDEKQICHFRAFCRRRQKARKREKDPLWRLGNDVIHFHETLLMHFGIKLYKVECQKHFQAKYAVHLHFRAKHTLILCCHFLNKSSSLVVKSPFDKEKRVFKPLCSVSPILSHVRRPRTFPLILHSTLQVYYANNFL